MRPTVSYREDLLKRLKSARAAAAYLNAALEDDDPRVFLIALKDVADAHGGMTHIASESGLSRESLYRTLSQKGNPRLTSLQSLLDAMGLHLAVKPGSARAA